MICPASEQTAALTIDLRAVVENYRLLAARAIDSQIAATIKADAYGLGITQLAPVLAAAGCAFFYVAHLAEGISLRESLNQQGVAPPIAVLHGIAVQDHAVAAAYQLLPVLCDLGAVEAWRRIAAQQNKKLPVIIHLDTGMNRLGLAPADVAALAAQSDSLAGLDVRYWLSHLACADKPEHPLNQQQLSLFKAQLRGLPPAPATMANSGGIFLGSEYHFQQVRPGCALYGINPTPLVGNPMRPVVRLTAPVLQLRQIGAGESVGYGASWRSKRLGKLAVLPVGYADGWLRSLSNRGHVFFGAHAAPIAGRVSMDLLTVDVTDVPDHLCAPGMPAELIGAQQDVDAVASAAGTIGYEILTSLGARYRRVYES